MAVTRFHVEIATAIGTGLVGVVGLIGSMQLGYSWEKSGPEAGYFPFSLILIAASIYNIGSVIVTNRSKNEIAREYAQEFLSDEQRKRLGVFLGEMIAFVVLSLFIGVHVGSAVYIAWTAWRHGGYRLPVAIAIGAIFSAVQFVVFEVFFLVPLLKGPLEAWLGIY